MELYNKSTTPAVRVVRFLAETQVRMIFQRNKANVGKWMRYELASLGPTYIKFGQFLSTRPDLLSKDIVKELELLQNDTPQVPFADIKAVIENSLTANGISCIEDVFEYIDPIPLASASIGQVHRGRIRKRNREVVVKVQKPCVSVQIHQDLVTLKKLNNLFLMTNSPRAQEINTIILQYEAFLSAELDFARERSHMHRFRGIMAEADLPVRIPQPLDDLSDTNVLVMEYVPSTKIDDVESLKKRGVDTTRVADMLIQAFLYQVINAAFVHCDPHPGNIGVTNDGETIVLYDFGNIVELSSSFKEALNQIMFAVYQKDAEEFVDILMKLNILCINGDAEILEARSFFTYFFNYLETLDFGSLRNSIRGGEFTGAIQSKLKLDADFFGLFRVFSLLDGTCSKLNQDFNYIDALTPFTEDMMFDMKFMDYKAKRDFNKLRLYPTLLQSTDMNITRMQSKLKQMEYNQNQGRVLLILYLIIGNLDNPKLLAIFTGMAISLWLYVSTHKE